MKTERNHAFGVIMETVLFMMKMAHIIFKSAAVVVFSAIVGFSANTAMGAALTAEEIQQIENEFGIVLTADEKTDLAAVVKLDAPHPPAD